MRVGWGDFQRVDCGAAVSGNNELSLPMPPEPMGEWREHAACKGMDPDIFFPERGDDVTTAKATCAGCQVRRECLDWALAVPEKDGIWGGLSPRARRGIRVPLNVNCGTHSKYVKGCRCDRCRQANTEYQRKRRAS